MAQDKLIGPQIKVVEKMINDAATEVLIISIYSTSDVSNFGPQTRN